MFSGRFGRGYVDVELHLHHVVVVEGVDQGLDEAFHPLLERAHLAASGRPAAVGASTALAKARRFGRAGAVARHRRHQEIASTSWPGRRRCRGSWRRQAMEREGLGHRSSALPCRDPTQAPLARPSTSWKGRGDGDALGQNPAVSCLNSRRLPTSVEVIDEPPHGRVRSRSVDGEFAHPSLRHVRMTPPARSLRSSTVMHVRSCFLQTVRGRQARQACAHDDHVPFIGLPIHRRGRRALARGASRPAVLHGSHPFTRCLEDVDQSRLGRTVSGV